AQHLGDPEVSDLFLNGDGGLFRRRGGRAEPVPGWPPDEDAARALAVGLVAAGGRHLDERTPCQDVHLGGGVRVHAVLPPVSASGTLLSIRVPRREAPGLGELVAAGLCSGPVHRFLREAVAARQNLLITGGTGSGKTTLLAALLGEVPHSERIVTIEDVAELRIRHPHRVSLEARQANSEGAGGIGVAQLLREALRMRPDRLVLGECRGAELSVLLGALNTGHDGGAGTVHASTLTEVPARLEALGALAGLAPQHLARQAVSALHLIVHLEAAAGRHRIARLGHPVLDGQGLLTVVPLTERSFGSDARAMASVR
ncbi:CpaF family protein, partial [Leucobacter sp. M11]|uniref:CpaF family protein n=1 Tax=Leucobacter sp. M11 TaxID=2993565 RepID=UPI002D80D0C7